MVDRDPEPEGFKARCIICGKPMVVEEAECDVVTPTGMHSPALHLCSESCYIQYRSMTDDERKELEDLHRPGATQPRPLHGRRGQGHS